MYVKPRLDSFQCVESTRKISLTGWLSRWQGHSVKNLHWHTLQFNISVMGYMNVHYFNSIRRILTFPKRTCGSLPFRFFLKSFACLLWKLRLPWIWLESLLLAPKSIMADRRGDQTSRQSFIWRQIKPQVVPKWLSWHFRMCCRKMSPTHFYPHMVFLLEV